MSESHCTFEFHRMFYVYPGLFIYYFQIRLPLEFLGRNITFCPNYMNFRSILHIAMGFKIWIIFITFFYILNKFLHQNYRMKDSQPNIKISYLHFMGIILMNKTIAWVLYIGIILDYIYSCIEEEFE